MKVQANKREVPNGAELDSDVEAQVQAELKDETVEPEEVVIARNTIGKLTLQDDRNIGKANG